MSEILNKFQKVNNKMIVNEIEIVYDEIREEEFKKILSPVLLDGDIEVDIEIVDSTERQKHYYFQGVKVCTDIDDALGNHRHYQELRVFLFTRDDGAQVEVTNFHQWTPDTHPCAIRFLTHALDQTEKHAFKVHGKNEKDLKPQSFFTKIRAENDLRQRVYQKMVESNPDLLITLQDGSSTFDHSKFQYSYDEKGKLTVIAKGKTVALTVDDDVDSKVAEAHVD